MSTTSTSAQTQSATPGQAGGAQVDGAQVDVRGPRFAAWITTAVLLAVLVASAFSVPLAATLLAVQAVVFAIGAWRGPRRHLRADLRETGGAPVEPGHRA